MAVCYAEAHKPLLADQVFTLNPKQNPPVIYSGHWVMSGIEPEGKVYIYICRQRVEGLVVEERTMKVVVVLVLVGSSAVMVDYPSLFEVLFVSPATLAQLDAQSSFRWFIVVLFPRNLAAVAH